MKKHLDKNGRISFEVEDENKEVSFPSYSEIDKISHVMLINDGELGKRFYLAIGEDGSRKGRKKGHVSVAKCRMAEMAAAMVDYFNSSEAIYAATESDEIKICQGCGKQVSYNHCETCGQPSDNHPEDHFFIPGGCGCGDLLGYNKDQLTE